MVPGSMSYESSDQTPAPTSDAFGREGDAVGRRLAEELHELRERALARLRDLGDEWDFDGKWSGGQGEGRAEGEAGDSESSEIPDDDLRLRERIQKCRDLRANLIHQWAAAHRSPASSDIQDLVRFNDAIDRTLLLSIARASERARKSREMFLAVLGHDLRTPLGAIVMASEYLAMRGELTERDLRLANRIRSSAQRMNGLVNDLLDFTRCRLGEGIPINPVRTSFGSIAAEVVEEIRAAHPDCELRCEIRESVQGNWDAGRLWQALSNLIENAVFHGGGAPVRVAVTADEGHVIARIHNVGVPIPAEDQERIFDPFEHSSAEKPGRRSGGGLGLGLYIAREIATAHGGSVTVASAKDSGTTFTFRVPREP